MVDVHPHPIDVPEWQLEALAERLALSRFPEPATVDGDAQGVTLGELERLVRRWRSGYDWRPTESWINDHGSSRAELDDGLGVHLLHVRSTEAGALPLLLCHGWPGSLLEFRRLVEPLTDPVAHGGRPEDAFHLVVPSMPGFGFSDKPTTTGWGIARVAAAWSQLMVALGYGDRWGAQGGDWGSAVVEAISRMRPEGLVGIHSNLPLVFPTPDEIVEADDEERAMIADAERYQRELSGYASLQSTRPQTIGYALADSPVGQAAWVLQLFHDVSDGHDPITRIGADEILDDVMLYWLTNTGASSARLYWEAERERAAAPPASEPNPVPAGFSVLPGEAVRASRRWIERRYERVVHYDQPDHGGHFAALENPGAVVAALRSTFRGLR